MRRIANLLLSLLLACSLAACSNQKQETPSSEPPVSATDTPAVSESRKPSEAESSQEPAENPTDSTAMDSSVLIVYFSRWGNTEYPDNVDAATSASIVIDGETYGTTEYVARMIEENVGGDLHLIQTQEPYPVDFDELRDLNHSEMDEGYLPALVESSLDISRYDTVFVGYPVWATDVPQAVLSFLDKYDLSGKKVIPFCTHDGYGAGNSYSTIQEASHAAESPEGLAIEAKDVPSAAGTVAAWLEEIGVMGESVEAESDETAITIPIGRVTSACPCAPQTGSKISISYIMLFRHISLAK